MLRILITSIVLLLLFIFIIVSVNKASSSAQDIFSYSMQIRNAAQKLDEIVYRAQVNVNVMADSISNVYDIKKQNDLLYNMDFIENINGLVRSVLSTSTDISGSWFQLNSELPFSAQAYNWFQIKDNQFIDLKLVLDEQTSYNREINPKDDPYYFSAIEKQKAVWSDVYTDVDTKESMLTLSAPIYKNQKLVGVVGMDILTDQLQNKLINMQNCLIGSEIYLLNSNNKIILSQLSDSLKPSSDKFLFINLFNRNDSDFIEYFEQGIKKTAFCIDLPSTYKIVIVINNKALFNQANQLIWLSFIIFGLLVLSIVFAYILEHKINNSSKLEQFIEELDKDKNPNPEVSNDNYESHSTEDIIIL